MSERPAASTRRWICTLAVLLPLAAGCSGDPWRTSWNPWRKMPLDSSTGFYQQASISYRLDAGKLQQPLDVARVEAQRISYEQVASSPLPDESIGTLSITYPHPRGRAGLAQARFTLDSAHAKPTSTFSWNPFAKKQTLAPQVAGSQPEVHETWVLDIPSAESDECFQVLSRLSFYNTERASSDAVLTVKLNGREVRKNWDQVPEFNALVQRVRRDGQLVAFSRPEIDASTARGAIVSTRAYDDLVARSNVGEPSQGQVAARGPGLSSAFAVPVAAPSVTATAPLPQTRR